MFPGEETAALRWVLEHLDPLVAKGVLSAAEALRMCPALANRAGPSVVKPIGTLGLLWRLHVMYRELLAALARGEVAESSLPALRSALHEQAMRAVLETLDRSRTAGNDAHGVLQELAVEVLGQECAAANLTARQVRDLKSELAKQLPERQASPRCAVCAESFRPGTPTVFCRECETPHHPDCWSYNGGCAVFACECRAADDVRSVVQRPGAELDSKSTPESRPAAGPVPSWGWLGQPWLAAALFVPLPWAFLAVPDGWYWMDAGVVMPLAAFTAWASGRVIDQKRRQDYGLPVPRPAPVAQLAVLRHRMAWLAAVVALAMVAASLLIQTYRPSGVYGLDFMMFLCAPVTLSILQGVVWLPLLSATAAVESHRPGFALELQGWVVALLAGAVGAFFDLGFRSVLIFLE